MRISQKVKNSKLSFLLIAFGVIIIALIAWQFYKYKIANKSIHTTIALKSKGLYSIHYDSLVIDEVRGIVHVKNIVITPNSEVFKQLVLEKKNPPILIKLTIPSLDILGINTPKALLNREIEGTKIKISDPIINIELNHFLKDTTEYNPVKEIYKELLGKFLKIKIDSIQILHANVVVSNANSNEEVFEGKNFSIMLSDLLIDSIANKDRSRILFSRNVDIKGNEILLPSKNKKYRLYIENLLFSTRTNSFYVGKIQLIPQLSEEAFAKISRTQKNRCAIILKGLELLHINLESLWHKKIKADSLIINKSSFNIYRDLSYPLDTISKVGKYPQQLLMHLPVLILIKNTVLLHSNIAYKIKSAKSGKSGTIILSNAWATIHNITNMNDAISLNNECNLIFKSTLLQKTPINLKLILLLKNVHGKFYFRGNIGTIKALAINPIIQPLGLARIDKGKISKLDFNFTGIDSSSSGKVILLYNGMKISLLKVDRKENKYDKKALASFTANLIVKNSNPRKNKKPRIAIVHYKRVLNRSFLYLILGSLLTGIKESAGIK